jgi:ssDNA-binding Zn-finger/Zn-ribbon topoisomerase 1
MDSKEYFEFRDVSRQMLKNQLCIMHMLGQLFKREGLLSDQDIQQLGVKCDNCRDTVAILRHRFGEE